MIYLFIAINQAYDQIQSHDKFRLSLFRIYMTQWIMLSYGDCVSSIFYLH